MKYLLILATLLYTGFYVGEANGDEPKAPSRRVIQAPNPKFTRPAPQRPQIQGKQQWQQRSVQQPKVETKHSFGFYNYNYYRPVNPHFRYYRVPSYYPPVIIQPPVVIQPQPMPIYPAPFHGFFFQFR